MGNNERRNRGFFIRLTRGKAKEIIQKKEERQGRKLNREERNRIIERVAKKTRNKVALYALVGTLGLGGGVAATNLLMEGQGITQQENEITIDASKNDKDIQINNITNDRTLFVNGLKVNIEDALDNEQETLKETVQQEIDNLESPEDVLNYIKGIYIQEYNEINNEDINLEDIKFETRRVDTVIYTDEAENGENILRYCSESAARDMEIRIDGEQPVISAYIQNGENREIERVAQNKNGEYQTVYSQNAEVQQNEETVLQELADLVSKGIDYSTSIEQKENNSHEVNRTYEQRFIDAVLEYKNNQIQEIVNGDTEAQQNQDAKEQEL